MLLLCCWAVAGNSSTALAETRRVLNLTFEIDVAREIDAKTTRVTIGSESWLVPTDQIDRHIVTHYLEKRGRIARFTIDDLLKFAREAIAQDQPEMASAALTAAFIHPGEQAMSSDIVSELAAGAGLAALRQAVLSVGEKSSQPALVTAALFHLAIRDVNWLRSRAVRLVLTYAEDIKKLAEERFNAAVKGGDLPGAGKIVDLLGGLFGSGDAEHETLRKRLGRVQYILQGLQGKDVASWSAFISMTVDDPVLLETLYPAVLERLHGEAAAAIEGREFQRALSILTNIESARRTPRTHELVANALQGLEPGDKVASDQQIDELLSTIALRDEGVRTAYIDFLEGEFSYLLAQDSPQDAEIYFRRLLRIRPDPSRDNDSLRIDHAGSYLRNQMADLAHAKIGEVRPGFSLWQWFRILLFWLWAHPWFGAFGFLVCLGLGFIAYLLFTEQWQPSPVKRPARPERETREAHEAPPIDLPRFVVSGLKEQLDPEYQEYVNCLKVFGLRPGASLSAIKIAYRNTVKEYHPDLNRDAQDMAAEVFIEMTRTYERLVDLHAKHGVA